jgi:hypothetical protein
MKIYEDPKLYIRNNMRDILSCDAFLPQCIVLHHSMCACQDYLTTFLFPLTLVHEVHLT